MGTRWKVTIYDEINKERLQTLLRECCAICISFDETYSRFKDTSLISHIAQNPGLHTVPEDLVVMLEMYSKFYKVTHGKFTPCIGSTLEDIGYDKTYSLIPKQTVQDVPDFSSAVSILDRTTVKTTTHVLLDLGALGKGYCVDLVSNFLQKQGIKRFLVDGSGDIFYQGNGVPITIGLEHPEDSTKVIGSISMVQGSMCASATNRRAWGEYSHYIDPHTKHSPREIIATWVIAPQAALADALSTVLFFIAPEDIPDMSYTYCIMNHEHKVKRSPDFSATLY